MYNNIAGKGYKLFLFSEKDAANSSSKQSRTKQTESKRPRKAQQSTVLLERIQRRRTKPRNIVSIANESSSQDDFAKKILRENEFTCNYQQ